MYKQLEKSLALYSKSGLLRKIKLPGRNDTKNYYSGVTATITGFGFNWINLHLNSNTGKIFEHGGWYDGQMKFLHVKILNDFFCKFSNLDVPLTDRHLCAQSITKEAAVCSGDSGGPLVKDGVVIAVLSGSPFGCDERVKNSVYTKVSYYLDFIEKAMTDTISKDIRVKVVDKSYNGQIIDYIRFFLMKRVA